jgi:hypothetical protein
VRAPQIKTWSGGVGDSGTAVCDDDCTGRSITSGGRCCRQPRPIKTPDNKRIDIVAACPRQCVLAAARKHLSQNLRLVHTRQRSRTIFSPHSQQKFGR